MEPISVTRVATDTIQAALKRLPDMILNFIGWLWKTYWKLGAVGKCIATVVVGVVALTVVGNTPLSAGARASARSAIESVMVLAILVAILVGVIRGRS